jgi:hypothetical protein
MALAGVAAALIVGVLGPGPRFVMVANEAVAVSMPARRWGGIAAYLASDAVAHAIGEHFVIDGSHTKCGDLLVACDASTARSDALRLRVVRDG